MWNHKRSGKDIGLVRGKQRVQVNIGEFVIRAIVRSGRIMDGKRGVRGRMARIHSTRGCEVAGHTDAQKHNKRQVIIHGAHGVQQEHGNIGEFVRFAVVNK